MPRYKLHRFTATLDMPRRTAMNSGIISGFDCGLGTLRAIAFNNDELELTSLYSNKDAVHLQYGRNRMLKRHSE